MRVPGSFGPTPRAARKSRSNSRQSIEICETPASTTSQQIIVFQSPTVPHAASPQLPLYASGYEPHGDDHHKNTFQALPVAMGDSVTILADYFDRCRRKRSNIDYDAVDIATESEAAELCKKTRAFRQQVVDWLLKHHPEICPRATAAEPTE